MTKRITMQQNLVYNLEVNSEKHFNKQSYSKESLKKSFKQFDGGKLMDTKTCMGISRKKV